MCIFSFFSSMSDLVDIYKHFLFALGERAAVDGTDGEELIFATYAAEMDEEDKKRS